MHYVFKNTIDDIFLKNAQIAIGLQILLEGLQFKASLVGYIMDGDGAEIRQARFRTYRSELRIIDYDFVSGKLVWPGFDFGKIVVKSGLSVLRSVTRRFGHTIILSHTLETQGQSQLPLPSGSESIKTGSLNKGFDFREC